ncbi:hypothetical protein D7030_07080 [Flavobacteriaceae bacterium AU392]|nr:hypothetical protein D1817_01340 [Flavobacteriaceae bacterium]RKM84891.1 hypothetical protein D7030_07080 [Flavobacteriaceae bacterium AU392]
MFKQFISLEWKQFLRASYFQKGIAIKILLVLAAVYFGGAALFLGAGMFFLIKKALPDTDPIVIVNNFLIFWFLLDLIIRFFMQQLPVMNIKPLMIIPIKRNTVIHYLLGKTAISFFNFIPLFIFTPFSVVLLFQGYSPLNVIFWFFSIVFLTLSTNLLNFLINKNNVVFYTITATLIALIGLEFYGIFKISEPIGVAFNALYNQPYLIIIPIFLMLFLYRVNFNFIRKGFYLDESVSKKVKEVNATDLSWMNRFGSLAPFLKNDIKMIWRNARPKQVMMMSFLFLFYGLIFYTQEIYREMPAFLAFASMFVTGGFLMSFGQLVPSWDSEYYKMLMSQNIPYRQYLESKWYLMVVAVSISFILSLPYLYFGWDIYLMIAAGALFNIGLNTFITLFGGALNRVPIELNAKAKAFSNTNGFNPTQLLIALPKFLLPMGLFYIPYKLINFDAGLIALALSGVLGIVFKNFFLNKIEAIYQKGKYKTIAAFAEKK